jgi:periplasmic protein TonB
MGMRLFEDVGVSAVAGGRSCAWPVSAGLHLAFAAAAVAASTLAGVELPAPAPSVHDPVCLPVALGLPKVAALPRKGHPLPTPPAAARRPSLPALDDRPPAARVENPPVAGPPIAEEPPPGPREGYGCVGCRPDGNPNGVVGATGGNGGTPTRPPLRISAGVTAPRKVHDAVPIYPPLALATRAEGRVLVECVIGVEGRVDDVRVVHGHPLLAEAAANAVRQWRYAPTLLNGEPVAVIMTVTVDFRLSR